MKQETFTINIDVDESNQRIDRYLSNHPEILSRSKASKYILDNLVHVNNSSIKPSYILCPNDIITMTIDLLSEDQPDILKPYDFPLNIVFEDSDLLVINKPSGLVVHPATSHKDDTLVNALIHYTSDLSLGVNKNRPGIVHRIDKDTSGLLVIAKRNSIHIDLAKQFKHKLTHRKYWAIVFGKLKSQSGSIESYLARSPKNRKKVFSTKDVENGKHAITHYKVLEEANNGLSWIELQLETGRTHQIRVHLSENGHPIAGDQTYCGAGFLKNLKSINLRKRIENLGRFALHATELGFKHPGTGEKMMFSVDWPEDLEEILEHSKFLYKIQK